MPYLISNDGRRVQCNIRDFGFIEPGMFQKVSDREPLCGLHAEQTEVQRMQMVKEAL